MRTSTGRVVQVVDGEMTSEREGIDAMVGQILASDLNRFVLMRCLRLLDYHHRAYMCRTSTPVDHRCDVAGCHDCCYTDKVFTGRNMGSRLKCLILGQGSLDGPCS